MKKVILLLIIFSLSSFISLANAGNIMYRSLSIGGVLDAKDFLFDSALGNLVKLYVGIYSYGNFHFDSIDPPPYSNNSIELDFYYETQNILKVENINLGSRIHLESDFGRGEFCSFNGKGGATVNAGTPPIGGKYYYDPDILSFFTLKENDTSVYLTSVLNDISPAAIYDDLFKEYEFSVWYPHGGQMNVSYFYTPVPEPSSCVFLLFGVLGLAAIRKRGWFSFFRKF